MMPQTSADLDRERAIRLFTFLKRLSELRTKQIRSIDEYERVLWIADIPAEPGCRTVWSEGSPAGSPDSWIEIAKPRLKAPPEIPGILGPWVDAGLQSDTANGPPMLRERIPNDESLCPAGGETSGRGNTAPVELDLNDHPEIGEAWQGYLPQWQTWAEEDRRLQRIQRIYTELFSIYQRQERLGEAYEVVLGLGFLTWRTTSREIKRHLLTVKAGLAFEPTQGVITVGPAAEGAKLALEQEMLEINDCPGVSARREIESRLEKLGDNIWGQKQVAPVLQAWVHAVSPDGRYEHSPIRQPNGDDAPRVHLAPAVILRKRTERSLINTLQEIIDQLQRGEPIPAGVERLLKLADDTGTAHGEPAEGPSIAGEIHFPLPANEQQTQIVAALAGQDGVLVQGPPGTGKSHTIANLICHLLATGNRVLVTSQTARALRVLREMIPRELSALCVSLLGEDRNALRLLEESVAIITSQYDRWDGRENSRQIERYAEEIEEIRREETKAKEALRELRERETFIHPPKFGYAGTAAAIAARLHEEEPLYSWLHTVPEELDSVSLSSQEASELLSLLRKLDIEREEDLAYDPPDPALLIDPDDFSSHLRRETLAGQRLQQVGAYQDYPAYKILEQIERDRRHPLLIKLAELAAAYEGLASLDFPPAKEAAAQIISGSDQAWQELRYITEAHLQAIGDRARAACERKITGLGRRDLSIVKRDAEALAGYLARGNGLGFGPLFLRPRPVKRGSYLIRGVRVDGRHGDNRRALAELLEWIEISEHLAALQRHWQPYVPAMEGSFAAVTGSFHDLCLALGKLLCLKEQAAEARLLIADIPGLKEPAWHEEDEILALIHPLQALAIRDEYAEARKALDELEGYLLAARIRPWAHPKIGTLLEAVRDRNLDRYADQRQYMLDYQRCRELYRGLKAVAPAAAKELAQDHQNGAWDERMSRIEAALNWARADYWLAEFEDAGVQAEYSRRLEQCRRRLEVMKGRLAAAKAWRSCFDRMTDEELAYLKAWQVSVGKIGRAAGKYTAQYRREAQSNMEKCRSAIPVWIMPIYRVVESVQPGRDAFDVVIVDEASQSGNEALFLMYLAKKIIVVGDEKQISPEFVGIDREQVNLLRDQLLFDLPLKEQFGLDTSLYTHADLRFRNAIRLREHFRCMPEIIQFSNDLCYGASPLEPLRQYGADRLEPIRVVHVADGYRNGGDNAVNPPEAAAIVEQIVACCKDPLYRGKSMGVISLQGSPQAAFIENLLLQRLDPKELQERNLISGDAYSFQGDERDVIFLSLVAAPGGGHRIGMLARGKDEQRFNVAASRAREQMWLFHTATLNDLHPDCLRHKLLNYCNHPKRQPTVPVSRRIDPDQLEPDLFDSLFAQRVYLMINAKGYRVIPHFEVNGYMIDMIVEGARGRLAVECDGDRWHGPEQWEHEMGRRHDLERCGYRFWRVRAGAFYRDPDGALQGLWDRLAREGIHPAGSVASHESKVTSRESTVTNQVHESRVAR